MNEDRIGMSQRERDRLKVMDLVLKGQRTQAEAGRLLNLTDRQIRRIQRRLEKDKDRGVIRRLRGRLTDLDYAGPSLKDKLMGLSRKSVLKAHLSVLAILEKLRGIGFEIDVHDEGGFWERSCGKTG